MIVIEEGNPLYDWSFVDLIFDTILKYKAKPFVEFSFMPQHLVDTTHYAVPKDNWSVQLYRSVGWACPMFCWYQLGRRRRNPYPPTSYHTYLDGV